MIFAVIVLESEDVIATVAVKNISAAAEFYEKKLGLKKENSPEKEILLYKTGNTKLLVYPSQFAGTNQATAATWVVNDVDATVRALKGKGVQFERYDFPGVTHEGDVHVSGKRRSAWFKDPGREYPGDCREVGATTT